MNYSPNDVRSAVAGEVRAHLARRDLNANQVAMRLGWTQPYLWRRLNGKVAFNVADLQAIADLLELPVTIFFQDPYPGLIKPVCYASDAAELGRAA